MSAYGLEVGRSTYTPLRSVIQVSGTSGSGNLILRVGREYDLANPAHWEVTEHVVLTPTEAAAFIAACQEALA